METKLRRLEELIKEQEYDERRLHELRGKIARETKELDSIKEARKICQIVLASTQSSFKMDVESLMTLAIKSVFKRFDFELEWKETASRSDLNFNIKDGDNVLNLDDDLGCSILDIISFSSRPVFHRYQHPRSRKLMVFDEPMKWVGQGEFLDRACRLVETVAHQRNYQLIIITHEPKFALMADKAFHVTNNGVYSTIGEMTNDDLAELLL